MKRIMNSLHEWVSHCHEFGNLFGSGKMPIEVGTMSRESYSNSLNDDDTGVGSNNVSHERI
jgi:hypothetical protein